MAEATAVTQAAHAGRVEERPTGFFAWLRRAVPTALAVAALGGLAYWGHHTDWNFGLASPGNERDSSSSANTAEVDFGAELPANNTAPSALRRSLTIRFPSAAAVDKAGIDPNVPVLTARMAETVPVSGEISFDPSHMARLSARTAGSAFRVLKTIGDPVQAGETLALIDSAEVGKVKAEVLQSIVQHRLKEKALADVRKSGQAVPPQQVKEAEAALRDAQVRMLGAEQALVNLGVPFSSGELAALPLEQVVARLRVAGLPADLKGVDLDKASGNLLPVRAPFAGQVQEANLVAGEVVEPGRLLFVIVNPRHLWLTLQANLTDLPRLALEQKVAFLPDGFTKEIDARVAWIGTAADETTRAVPVRALLKNDAGLMRASTLGQGRIIVREAPEARVAPNEAVHQLEGVSVLFSRHPDYLKPDGPKSFILRVVRTGATDGSNTEILDGLKFGEVIAGKGSSFLLSEAKRALAAVPARR